MMNPYLVKVGVQTNTVSRDDLTIGKRRTWRNRARKSYNKKYKTRIYYDKSSPNLGYVDVWIEENTSMRRNFIEKTLPIGKSFKEISPMDGLSIQEMFSDDDFLAHIYLGMHWNDTDVKELEVRCESDESLEEELTQLQAEKFRERIKPIDPSEWIMPETDEDLGFDDMPRYTKEEQDNLINDNEMFSRWCDQVIMLMRYFDEGGDTAGAEMECIDTKIRCLNHYNTMVNVEAESLKVKEALLQKAEELIKHKAPGQPILLRGMECSGVVKSIGYQIITEYMWGGDTRWEWGALTHYRSEEPDDPHPFCIDPFSSGEYTELLIRHPS